MEKITKNIYRPTREFIDALKFECETTNCEETLGCVRCDVVKQSIEKFGFDRKGESGAI